MLPWVAVLPTANSGWLAKVVPDTGISCEKSPKNITSNPPNGRSVPSARRFQLSRFQVTLPIRMSRTPTSCAEIVDENPTQTLPLRRQLMRVLGESSAVCLTQRDARPVVQSAAIYLRGHRILDEANELHAMGPACADPSQANQLILDLKHHATNPPPATPQAALASAESAKR